MNAMASRVQIKENIKAPRHWPLWPVTGEFPAQKASDAENISIWWRHHEMLTDFNNNGEIDVNQHCLPRQQWTHQVLS